MLRNIESGGRIRTAGQKIFSSEDEKCYFFVQANITSSLKAKTHYFCIGFLLSIPCVALQEEIELCCFK